jgi:hypothetical protein
MFVEFNKDSPEKKSILQERVSPSQKLEFANKIMVGFAVIYSISIIFFALNKDPQGEMVYEKTHQAICNFLPFILGFYFSRK